MLVCKVKACFLLFFSFECVYPAKDLVAYFRAIIWFLVASGKLYRMFSWLKIKSRLVWSAKIVNSNISHSSSLVLCGFYLIQRFCNPNSRVDVVFKMWCISKLGTKRIMSLRKCVICCTIRNAQRIHKRT